MLRVTGILRRDARIAREEARRQARVAEVEARRATEQTRVSMESFWQVEVALVKRVADRRRSRDEHHLVARGR